MSSYFILADSFLQSWNLHFLGKISKISVRKKKKDRSKLLNKGINGDKPSLQNSLDWRSPQNIYSTCNDTQYFHITNLKNFNKRSRAIAIKCHKWRTGQIKGVINDGDVCNMKNLLKIRPRWYCNINLSNAKRREKNLYLQNQRSKKFSADYESRKNISSEHINSVHHKHTLVMLMPIETKIFCPASPGLGRKG